MIDFSTNKYIHNIQIEHLHGTLPRGSYRISIFVFPFLSGPYTNKQLPSSPESYITHLKKWHSYYNIANISSILPKKRCSSYLMSLPKKDNSSFIVFINVNNTVKLTILPSSRITSTCFFICPPFSFSSSFSLLLLHFILQYLAMAVNI